MHGVDFFFGEMIWRVTAAFEFLECLDREKWADPLVSKAGVERSTEGGISHDAGFWGGHCSQLFHVPAEIGDDFVLLMCCHGWPDCVEWFPWESLILDHLSFRPVEDIDHLPCRNGSLAINQLKRLVLGAPTRGLDDPVVAQAQDCITRFQILFAFSKVHEPPQGKRNRVILVTGFADLVSEAERHFGCHWVLARLPDRMVQSFEVKTSASFIEKSARAQESFTMAAVSRHWGLEVGTDPIVTMAERIQTDRSRTHMQAGNACLYQRVE